MSGCALAPRMFPEAQERVHSNPSDVSRGTRVGALIPLGCFPRGKGGGGDTPRKELGIVHCKLCIVS